MTGRRITALRSTPILPLTNGASVPTHNEHRYSSRVWGTSEVVPSDVASFDAVTPMNRGVSE